MAMKHRISKTEEGGKALKALKESTERGTQTLDLSCMDQFRKKEKNKQTN